MANPILRAPAPASKNVVGRSKSKLRPNSSGKSAPGSEPTLSVVVNGENRVVNLSDLMDANFVATLDSTCRGAPKKPLFCFDQLLAHEDREQLAVLEFVTGLRRYQVMVGDNRFENAFDAVISMMVGTANMVVFTKAKLAALEAAVLTFPEALDGACNRIVAQLRDLSVKGIKASDILSDAKKILKALQSRSGTAESSQAMVRDLFPDSPAGAGIVIPRGWRVSDRGVERAGDSGGELVMDWPVLVTERGVDASKETLFITLAWFADGRWHQKVIDRSVVASARSVVDLAAFGIPVNSNTASKFVRYIADFEAANLDALPVGNVVHQLGWHGESGGGAIRLGQGVDRR